MEYKIGSANFNFLHYYFNKVRDFHVKNILQKTKSTWEMSQQYVQTLTVLIKMLKMMEYLAKKNNA